MISSNLFFTFLFIITILFVEFLLWHILLIIYELNEKYNDTKLKGLHNDIEKAHQQSNLDGELKKIQKMKEDIVKTIFDLKIKREDTMLTVDKIMFDNNVMVECVLRNFTDLGKIC